MRPKPTLQDIEEAAERIQPYAHRTPVLTCHSLNEMTGTTLFFKCENFQKVGAFKFRGACNTVFHLTPEELRYGVATHSSGNHGAALALAARLRGAQAHIVMPRTAPAVKRAAVESYGAHIVTCEPTLESREATLQDLVKHTGSVVVHPYNDHRIMAGQGTAALELVQDVPDLDAVICPVGGGGLISGTAVAVSNSSPYTLIIGAEPTAADDAYRSLQEGKIVPSHNPQTIADGLRTSLGDLTFPVIKMLVHEIVTVSEKGIVDAMRHVWERMKIIIEASSAVPVAAIFERPEMFKSRRVGIIISGGNVDLDNLPW